MEGSRGKIAARRFLAHSSKKTDEAARAARPFFATVRAVDTVKGTVQVQPSNGSKMDEWIPAVSAPIAVDDVGFVFRTEGGSWIFARTGPFTFTSDVAPHTHPASDIVSGTLNEARIPSLAISKITGLQTALDDKVTLNGLEWTIVTGSIENLQDDVSDLQSNLDDKVSKSAGGTQSITGSLQLSGSIGATGGIINGIIINGDPNNSWPWGEAYLNSPRITDAYGAPKWDGDTGLDVSKINGLQAALDGKVNTIDYSIDKLANSTAHTNLQTAIDAKANAAHTHPVTDIDATGGTSTSYLRKDGTWATPTNTTYSVMSQAEAEAGTATTARTMSAQRLKATILYYASTGTHTHPISDIVGLQTALDGKVDDDIAYNVMASLVPQHETRIDTLEATVDDLSSGGAPHSHSNLSTLNAITAAFTTELLNKLNGIQTGAEVNVQSDWNAASGDAAILNKPTTMPPSAHTHLWADITDKPASFPPAAHGHGWTSITGKPTEFPPESHTHLWADITDKPSTFAPASHSHAWADITGKPTTFTPETHSHAWSEITGKPTTFAPSSHGHTIGEITGLQAALDDTIIKSNTNTQTMQGGLYVTKAITANQSIVVNGGGILNGNNTGNPGTQALYINSPAFTDLFGPPVWSGDTGLDVAKINGLVAALAGKADVGHTHPVSDIAATGTPSGTTYLRGDGQWVTPPNTTYSAMSEAEMQAGTATTSRVITAQRLKQAVGYHPPAAHSHAIADVTGLQTALDSKADSLNVSIVAAAVADLQSDVSDLETGKANVSHTHAAGDVTSGTFADARIPNLAASKITSGTFNEARIPSLPISRITNLQSTLDGKVDDDWHQYIALGTQFTTTSNSFQTVTGLNRAVGTNQRWLLTYVMPVGNSGAGGMDFSLQAPAGSSLTAMAYASDGVNGSAMLTSMIASPGAFGLVAAKSAYSFGVPAGMCTIQAIVETGGTSGNISLQVRSMTSGQTSAVGGGSIAARLAAIRLG